MIQSLQHQIIQLANEEQNLRKEWCEAGESDAHQLRVQIKTLDLKNALIIQEIIEKYGWPGFKLVGTEGSHSFFILVQHSPDVSLKEKALKLLQQAVLNQDAAPDEFALLTDRVRVLKGLPQLYGTQFKDDLITICPIEDEEQVEERRKAVGLCSMEENRHIMESIYKNRMSPK